MLTRVRYKLEDARYWVSGRLGSRRRGRTTISLPDSGPRPGRQPRRRRPRLRIPGRRRPRLRTPGSRVPWPVALGSKLRRASRSRGAAMAAGALGALGAVAVALLATTGFDFGGDPVAGPAPRVIIEEEAVAETAPELGFPAFATRNTTRVGGDDPVADAAGAALAANPATGGVQGPPATVLVGESDWPAGIAAASLVAEPVGAPILLTGSGEVPELTLTALTALAPRGSPDTGDAQIFRIGDVAVPEGLRVREVDGGNPAELAARIAALRRRLTGEKPERVLIASSDEPGFAMPAAAWAARSGDPVLFTGRESVPRPTLRALRRMPDARVYVLGPAAAISEDAMSQLESELESNPTRISGDDPTSNAIAFARFTDGEFGWDITDPGHGLVIASSSRPADAAAAAPLSAAGKWGPLLVIDDPDVLPPALQGFLLDIKPGYVDDPVRAVYNHAWLIGDDDAVSVGVQAQIDELLELTKVESGRGGLDFTTVPGRPESEPQPDQKRDTG